MMALGGVETGKMNAYEETVAAGRTSNSG